jgi:hypothetical protein
MSGNVRGIIDCRPPSSQSYRLGMRDMFKRYVDFFESHPNMTRIALRRRNGTPGASNLGYWDAGATSWADGNTASGDWHGLYAVYRVNPSGSRTWPYYVMIITHENSSQVGYLAKGTTIPNTECAVLLSVAVGHGGDENPWNGTTNNNGSDAIPTQFWKVPTGGTHVSVLPSSNNTGYTHATNKNNFIALFGRHSTSNTQTTARWGAMGDDDTLVLYYDDGDNGVMEQVTIITPYTPRTGITVTRPLIMFNSVEGVPSNDAQVGQANGTEVSSSRSGGITPPDAALALSSPREGLHYFWMLPTLFTATAQPNYYTGQREVWPSLFRAYGFGPGNDADPGGGYIGYVPPSVYGVTSGFNNFDLTLDKKTVFIGDSTPTNVQIAYPFWDGATTPRTTLTRDGVSFSRAP